MSFRPSGYIGWCSTGATNVAEPTDAKKAVGWAINEQPPSSYFNWIQQKVDAWVQYFAWESALRPVVYDDFSRHLASGFTGFHPLWTAASGSWQFVDPNVAGAMDAQGTIKCFADTTGIFDFKTRSAGAGNNDWRLEARVYYSDRGGAGTALELGAFDFFGFHATGPSSTWGFQFTPSGKTPTSFDVGVDPISSTFKKLVAERHGATMAVFVDDVLRVSVAGVAMGYTSFEMGGKIKQNTALDSITAVVDSFGYWVKR